MTKVEYHNKLKKLLQSMIGKEVVHETFGTGTIIAIEDNKCIVKYNNFEDNKIITSERFFHYNEPVSEELFDEYKALKCEYDLSKKANLTKQNRIEDSIEPEIKPSKNNTNITFDDVIGLDNVKEMIYQMVVYPFVYSDIYQAFKRDSGGGILLYGAPGTGKTMIAKAIANEIDAKFYSIKCSDIVSKWYGESERKIKELFQNARKNECSIIFFDEFDALGANRNDSHVQTVNRLVSELLSQIDGFESKDNTILLIASTNKPWDIDSALLRSGRFNKKIYIGLPDKVSRYNLLVHELKDLPVNNIDYESIVVKTEGYSNADMVELCNEAKDIAIKRSIELEMISPITQDDLIEAMSLVKSTIVKQELDRLINFKLSD